MHEQDCQGRSIISLGAPRSTSQTMALRWFSSNILLNMTASNFPLWVAILWL